MPQNSGTIGAIFARRTFSHSLGQEATFGLERGGERLSAARPSPSVARGGRRVTLRLAARDQQGQTADVEGVCCLQHAAPTVTDGLPWCDHLTRWRSQQSLPRSAGTKK